MLCLLSGQSALLCRREVYDVRDDINTFTTSLIVDLSAQFRSPLLNRCRSRHGRGDDFDSIGSKCFGDSSPIMHTWEESATEAKFIEA